MKSLQDYIKESMVQSEYESMIMEMSSHRQDLLDKLPNRIKDCATHIVLVLCAKYQNPDCEELYTYWIKELYSKHIDFTKDFKFRTKNSYGSRLKFIKQAYNNVNIETYEGYEQMCKAAIKREERGLKRGKKSYLVKVQPEKELYRMYLRIIDYLKESFAKDAQEKLEEFRNFLDSYLL